jgi:nicotinamide riboside kinase
VLREQSRAEVDAVHGHCDTVPSVAGPWLVCDTDAIATVVWWDRYLATPSVNAMNFAQPYLGDLYVVTDPQDVVFVQDGIRDGEHLRHEMHNSFVEIARKTNKPVIIATGSREDRVSQLITEIEKYEKKHPRFFPT